VRRGHTAEGAEVAELLEHEEERGTWKKGDGGGLTAGEDDAAGGSEGQGDCGAVAGEPGGGEGENVHRGVEEREGGGFGGRLTGGPHQGVAATAQPPASAAREESGGAGRATRRVGPQGGGGARPRLGHGGRGEPAGPRRRASPREGGLSWAEGGRGAARWAARRKRGEKGLGGFYFPFLFALLTHLDAYFTNSLNHKQKDA
jgi:hypothetical protein